jgi:hypothetical protein
MAKPHLKNSFSVWQGINLSFPQKYSLRAQVLHIEHLTRQWEHLHLVRNFHLEGMSKVRDPQIHAMHRDIAASLQQAISEYETLLAELRQDF